MECQLSGRRQIGYSRSDRDESPAQEGCRNQPLTQEQVDPMSTFFQGQMDYIFFFYGLAFIGLGVVAYILSKEVNQRLPWGWLALFGFTHGANEWLDLVALSWADGVVFGALRWAILTVSFLCLVEFGRLSLVQRRGRGPGRWLWSSWAWAPAWGLWAGWNGLNATTRYCLGLVGSLGAGLALLRRGQRCRPPVPPLAAGRRRRFHPLRPGHRRGGAPGRVLAGRDGKLRDVRQPHGPADPTGAGPAGVVDRLHNRGLFPGFVAGNR